MPRKSSEGGKLRNGIPVKEYYRNWYLGRKELYKESHIKRTYGLTIDDLLSMLEKQDYLCSICSVNLRDKDPKNIHIDHCHNSEDMKVRGILCNKCNMALGLFNDDTKIILKAIKYLEKHA